MGLFCRLFAWFRQSTALPEYVIAEDPNELGYTLVRVPEMKIPDSL